MVGPVAGAWWTCAVVLAQASLVNGQIFASEAQLHIEIGSHSLFIVWCSVVVVLSCVGCCVPLIACMRREKVERCLGECDALLFCILGIGFLIGLGWFIVWVVVMVPTWQTGGLVFSSASAHSTGLFFAWCLLILPTALFGLAAYYICMERPKFSWRRCCRCCWCALNWWMVVWSCYRLTSFAFLVCFVWWGAAMLPIWTEKGTGFLVTGIIFLSVVLSVPGCCLARAAYKSCRAYYIKVRARRRWAWVQRQAVPCKVVSELTSQLQKPVALSIAIGALPDDTKATSNIADEWSALPMPGESSPEGPHSSSVCSVPPSSVHKFGCELGGPDLEEGRRIAESRARPHIVELGEEIAKDEIGPEVILQDIDNSIPVLVHVEPPRGAARTPVEICIVIDTSASMGEEAEVQDRECETRRDGLSLLDVAKHGINTIISALGPSDRLAVVSFDTSATIVSELTGMDASGKAAVQDAVAPLQPGGGTDIWKGLHQGMELFQCVRGVECFRHLMLLTDGRTNQQGSVMSRLLEYKGRYERLPCTINTFGFGYSIDSQLLCDLASSADGAYAFIPDAGFVGTAFVSLLSTLLMTMACDVYLNVEPESGASILEVLGQLDTQRNGDGFRVSLGTLQYEQSRDVVLRMAIPTCNEIFLVATLQYELVTGERVVSPCVESTLPSSQPSVLLVEPQLHRCSFVHAIHHHVCAALRKGSPSSTIMQSAESSFSSLAGSIQSSTSGSSREMKALLQDISGQACEAISSQEWFSKWGQHYLPSLMFAHKLQRCNNFKDPGVQAYGGKMFSRTRIFVDEVFNSLPPPTPSKKSASGGGGGRVVSMSAYNDCFSGCIDGSSQIQLANGKVKYVSEVLKGDRVRTSPQPNGGRETAIVSCVVKSTCPLGHCSLVELSNGLRLTPYHPVFMNGTWHFPADLAPVKQRQCKAVYSFVLNNASSLLVDSIPCISLGHGLEDGVAKHPYFGSSLVIEDLAKFKGFASGMVTLSPSSILRDPQTGVVCGIVEDSVLAEF